MTDETPYKQRLPIDATPSGHAMRGAIRREHTGTAPVHCPACGSLLRWGEYTTLITLGPGADPEARALARKGEPYLAVAIEVHWECATGGGEP